MLSIHQHGRKVWKDYRSIQKFSLLITMVYRSICHLQGILALLSDEFKSETVPGSEQLAVCKITSPLFPRIEWHGMQDYIVLKS